MSPHHPCLLTHQAQAVLAAPQLQQLSTVQALNGNQMHVSHGPIVGDLAADNPLDTAKDRAGSAAQQLKDNLPEPNIPAASNTVPGE